MPKYRLTRDFSGNGTAPNNTKAPKGQIAPKFIYLTKKLKKGDIIEGDIATEDSAFGIKGKSIAFKTMGATTTNGVPYSDLALLYIPIENDGALEELDSVTGKAIQIGQAQEPFYEKHKDHIVLLLIVVAGYFAIKSAIYETYIK